MTIDARTATLVGIAFITFLLVRNLLQTGLRSAQTNLLAAAVAGIAFFGLLRDDRLGVGSFLLPYQVLAIAIPLTIVLLIAGSLLRGLSRRRGNGAPHSSALNPTEPTLRERTDTSANPPPARGVTRDRNPGSTALGSRTGDSSQSVDHQVNPDGHPI